MRKILLLMLTAFSSSAWAFDAGRFNVTDAEIPAPWRRVRFDTDVPATRYRIMEWDGIAAVEAIADSSMALLARPVTVDLAQTPVLCWRWRVDAVLHSADLKTKAGDDYAARLYAVFELPDAKKGFFARLKSGATKHLYGVDVPDAALNYVWDNRYPIGTRHPNAYASQNLMVVLRSGNEFAGRWVAERRDIDADAVSAFGADKARLVSLAIGSDTDNTGERARAGFADLHFVARDEECVFPAPAP